MDNLNVRLNFDLGGENNIDHRNSKEHLKITKIVKFGSVAKCEKIESREFAKLVNSCITSEKNEPKI